jgi:uncharacterized membrane protein
MSTLSQVAWFVFFIAGFFCFAYSWFVLLKKSHDKSFRWRDRVSVLALLVLAGAVLLRFVMPVFWGSDFSREVHTAQACTRVSVRGCAVALLLGLAGRPRLILPVVVASLATASFWVMSTIP